MNIKAKPANARFMPQSHLSKLFYDCNFTTLVFDLDGAFI